MAKIVFGGGHELDSGMDAVQTAQLLSNATDRATPVGVDRVPMGWARINIPGSADQILVNPAAVAYVKP